MSQHVLSYGLYFIPYCISVFHTLRDLIENWYIASVGAQILLITFYLFRLTNFSNAFVGVVTLGEYVPFGQF